MFDDYNLRLQAFLEERAGDFDNIEKAIGYFVETYNASLQEGKTDFMSNDRTRALEYLEKGIFAVEPYEKRDFFKKAYELDPDNLDIVAALTLEEYDVHEAHAKLEKIVDQYYRDHQARIKESAYFNIDNRPFFRVKVQLMLYYKSQLRYPEAERLAKESLRLNKNDNLGVRYELMSMYVQSFQFKKVRSFFKSDPSYREDEQMVLYLITSLVLEGDFPYARQEIQRLWDMSPSFIDYFSSENFGDAPAFDAMFEGHLEFYFEDSLEEVFGELLDIYVRSGFLYQFIRETLRDLDPDHFEKIENRLIDIYPDHFDDIQTRYIDILEKAGYWSLEDFGRASRRDILAIDGIGKGTVDKLEANGVRFKKT